jgi:adenine-specific DNA-methyltransferase
MFELLSDKGSIYLHLDNNMAFQAKLLLDEIFGVKNFRGFITRKKCSKYKFSISFANFQKVIDSLFLLFLDNFSRNT